MIVTAFHRQRKYLGPVAGELLLCLLLIPVWTSGAATNLYSTGFEAAQGFDSKFELVGQNGWVRYPDGGGGNGLVTNFFGSQAAYVGLFALQPRTNFLSVYQPINYSPPLTNNPVVKFSVRMAVLDSTTQDRDSFYWSLYNTRGDHLFTLDFDNYDLGVYYLLDGTNDFRPTGISFTNDVPYTLEVTMDFARNQWSATLDRTNVLAASLPLTTVGAPVDIGDIDAIWAIYAADKPGDNFMVFDDYQLTAESGPPAPQARLTILDRTTAGWTLLRLAGPSNTRHAIEGSVDLLQWTPLTTNNVVDGTFDFVDTSSAALPFRFYRSRVVP
jgi:hypothetical protein